MPMILYSMLCFYCRTRDQKILDTYDIVLYAVFFIVEPGTRRNWIPVILL